MDLSVWYLVGAVLVFFMQCGFAMVEAGFTRAKNAGNIIMKNLMDFCIGTVVFILLGYGIMNSENYFFGLIGMPEYQMFTDFYGFDWSNFFFQLVFCATAATIVSGAMAERTKFLAYCVYSGVISAVIYPIEAGWVWNGQGWLVGLGYVDFAGSSVIHMVGGLSALVGAWMLGPRLGKYTREKDGTLRVNAIPGHSLTLGALGCFILWFCWYGFNGAAAADTAQLAQILGNTTLAPAVATFVCMVFTWKRGGKPDVSMCLNASLAGLVGITAPAPRWTPWGLSSSARWTASWWCWWWSCWTSSSTSTTRWARWRSTVPTASGAPWPTACSTPPPACSTAAASTTWGSSAWVW